MARRGKSSKPDYIQWMLWAGAALALLAVGVLLFNRQHFFHHDAKFNPADYPVRGIDVSNHNGKIDWKQVADAGYCFAFIKASEGKTHVDNSLKRNVREAREAGLQVGVYHFFRKNRDGAEQARNFLKAIAGIQLDLPLVVDVEDWENDHWQDDGQVQHRVRELVNSLRQSGHDVMIYTNGDGFDKYYRPNFKDLDLWLCSFRSPDSLRVTHQHRFQQYSHWGDVPGIDGDVDLNVFMGNEHDWELWLRNNH